MLSLKLFSGSIQALSRPATSQKELARTREREIGIVERVVLQVKRVEGFRLQLESATHALQDAFQVVTFCHVEKLRS